jgi:hypothetical protein
MTSAALSHARRSYAKSLRELRAATPLAPTEQWFHAWRHVRQVERSIRASAYAVLAVWALAAIPLLSLVPEQVRWWVLPAITLMIPWFASAFGIVIRPLADGLWSCFYTFFKRLFVDARYELPPIGTEDADAFKLLEPLNGIGREYERRNGST